MAHNKRHNYSDIASGGGGVGEEGVYRPKLPKESGMFSFFGLFKNKLSKYFFCAISKAIFYSKLPELHSAPPLPLPPAPKKTLATSRIKVLLGGKTIEDREKNYDFLYIT